MHALVPYNKEIKTLRNNSAGGHSRDDSRFDDPIFDKYQLADICAV
jgi:hypothetical protein